MTAAGEASPSKRANLVEALLSTATLRLLCALVGAGGLLLVIGGLRGTGTIGWPSSVVGPGAGLIAAAVAGLVALRGVQTWRDKQAEHAAAATRENRSRVYEQILAHIIGSFAGGTPPDQEPAVRAMAASWASAGTLQALADWFRYASLSSGEGSNKSHSFEVVYRVAAAMRLDIDPGTAVSKDDILRVIFNDYDPAKHNPEGVSQIRLRVTGTVVGP